MPLYMWSADLITDANGEIVPDVPGDWVPLANGQAWFVDVDTSVALVDRPGGIAWFVSAGPWYPSTRPLTTLTQIKNSAALQNRLKSIGALILKRKDNGEFAGIYPPFTGTHTIPYQLDAGLTGDDFYEDV